MQIFQGEIYLSDLSPIKGHEQSGYRPVLIVQNNILNQNLSTVVIIPITSNLKHKENLTVYFLKKENSFLKNDSLALLFQIRSIDKSRLIKRVGNISGEEFLNIKKKLNNIF
jgi:mRNA interferase MazF